MKHFLIILFIISGCTTIPHPVTGDNRFELTKIDPVLYNQIRYLKDNQISVPLIDEDRSGRKKYKILKVSNRFDEHTDLRRSIRENDFKLIYNGDTSSPVYKSVRYRKQMQTMQILDSLEKNRELNNFFSNWFSKRKNSFEWWN